MGSILNSQGVVLATAMAVSGTVILLTLRLQKSFPAAQFQSPPPLPRSCISSDRKKREKKKKRVQFAEDVVDPIGNSDEFRRQHNNSRSNSDGFSSSNSSSSSKEREKGKEVRGMPANRAALYNGILRDRLVHHRLAYSY